MAKATSYVPEGYYTATPYMIFNGAAKAIELYKKAFDAKELFRMDAPGGKIGHAEIQIGNSRIMLADEHPEMGAKSPQSFGGSPVSLMLYVEDVDAWAKQATACGMKTLRPVQDQFYGDRSGTFEDPFGYSWTLATHTEDLTPAEMEARAKAAFQNK